MLGCGNKMPQTGWLLTTQIAPRTAPEARSLKSRGLGATPPESCRGGPLLPRPLLASPTLRLRPSAHGLPPSVSGPVLSSDRRRSPDAGCRARPALACPRLPSSRLHTPRADRVASAGPGAGAWARGHMGARVSTAAVDPGGRGRTRTCSGTEALPPPPQPLLQHPRWGPFHLHPAGCPTPSDWTKCCLPRAHTHRPWHRPALSAWGIKTARLASPRPWVWGSPVTALLTARSAPGRPLLLKQDRADRKRPQGNQLVGVGAEMPPEHAIHPFRKHEPPDTWQRRGVAPAPVCH